MTKNISIQVGDEFLKYQIEGETGFGVDEVLIESDDNVIQDAPWEEEGFTISPLLSDREHGEIKEKIRRLVYGELQKMASVPTPGFDEFSLEKYHEVISSDENHLALVMGMREGFPVEELPIPIRIFEKRISEVCRCELSVINRRMKEAHFYIRIVRPMAKGDNNPPHRDVWLDRLRDGVNLYLPVVGSDERSALPLVPRSHYLKESEIERTVEGTKVDGREYRVPAVTAWKTDIAMIRPNPRPGEMLLFSPYLIHGGGANFNRDTTRMSLEMRFFRKNPK